MIALILLAVSFVLVVAFARFQDSALSKRVKARKSTNDSAHIIARLNLLSAVASSKLVKTGGYTLSWAGKTPKSGYAVSLPGNESVYGFGGSSLTESEAYGIVGWYFEQKFHLVESQKSCYFGGWVDSGKLYCDVSIVVSSLAEAKRLGKLYNQLAVYDIAKGETIYL